MASPMNPLPEKRIIIIAGPNGAGKTTLARELLLNEASTPTFINADLLAAGLNPLQPERAAVRAGRMMLEMIDACVQRGENFAFETTLSGRGYARHDSTLAGAGILRHVVLSAIAIAGNCDGASTAACVNGRASRAG